MITPWRMLVLVFVLLLAGVCLRFVLVQQALERARAHAVAAEDELRELQEHPSTLDLSRLEHVLDEASAARQEIASIEPDVNLLHALLVPVSWLPVIGPDAGGARHLLGMLTEGLTAWDAIAKGARSTLGVFSEPKGLQGSEKILRVAEVSRQSLYTASRALTIIQSERQQMPEAGLSPGFSRLLAAYDKQIPRLSTLLSLADEALQVLPVILGSDGERTYLVLVQDSGEIRPTGGFIGNYGIIKIAHGQIVEQKFADVYTIDWPYYDSGKSSPPVAMFKRFLPESTFWALRDANLWPDYPRSARQAALFAVEEGAVDHVDGVIAVNPSLAGRLLQVTGPITIQGVDETVTAENFEESIRQAQNKGEGYEVAQRSGGTYPVDRKLFTSSLIKVLIERMNGMDVSTIARLLPVLQESVRQKEVLLYFDDPRLQSLSERYDAAGEMKPSSSDYLWIVDMNLSASKDNLYIKQSARYTLTLGLTGEAIADLAIDYDYRTTGDTYAWGVLRGFYGDYLRVYVPAGSTLLSSDGVDDSVGTLAEQGKTVFETFLKIHPGTQRTVHYRYRIPLKLWRHDNTAAYALLLQKQPSSNIRQAVVTIVAPDGAVVRGTKNLEADSTVVRFSGPLPSDLSFEMVLGLP